MHSAALVASLTAVSMRMASSGSISSAWGTRSTPLVPGMRMSESMSATLCRRSCCSASSAEPAVYTSNCCCLRNLRSAFRIGASSSTTRIRTMGQPVLDARFEVSRDGAHELLPEVAAYDIAAEGQREICLLVPPLAEVRPEVQPAIAVGQLAFVDQKTGVGFSGRDEVLDLIERHDDMPDGWLIQSQREKRGREFAGHGYEPSRERTSRTLPRRRFARDEARPVAIANARAMREQGIPVGEIRDRKSTRLNSSHGYISYA